MQKLCGCCGADSLAKCTMLAVLGGLAFVAWRRRTGRRNDNAMDAKPPSQLDEFVIDGNGTTQAAGPGSNTPSMYIAAAPAANAGFHSTRSQSSMAAGAAARLVMLPPDYSTVGRQATGTELLHTPAGWFAFVLWRHQPVAQFCLCLLRLCSDGASDVAGGSLEGRSASVLAQRGTAEDPLLTYIRSQVLRGGFPGCASSCWRGAGCLPSPAGFNSPARLPAAPCVQLRSLPAQPASGTSTPLSGAQPNIGRRVSGTAALWSIAFEELDITQIIGLGSFGRVYRAEW